MRKIRIASANFEFMLDDDGHGERGTTDQYCCLTSAFPLN